MFKTKFDKHSRMKKLQQQQCALNNIHVDWDLDNIYVQSLYHAHYDYDSTFMYIYRLSNIVSAFNKYIYYR